MDGVRTVQYRPMTEVSHPVYLMACWAFVESTSRRMSSIEAPMMCPR